MSFIIEPLNKYNKATESLIMGHPPKKKKKKKKKRKKGKKKNKKKKKKDTKKKKKKKSQKQERGQETNHEKISEKNPANVILTKDELKNKANDRELKKSPDNGVNHLFLQP